MTILALIPARGGSKGIPRKNILPLAGKPLIAWTIKAAQDANRFTEIVVSTDDDEIADVARSWGASVLKRPDELANDTAAALLVLHHALVHHAVDTAVLLQPTSPLRTARDISDAINLHLKTGRPVVSIVRTKPWLFTLSPDGSLDAFRAIADQRQAETFFSPNGAIYVVDTKRVSAGETWWTNSVGYEMPTDRSVDIDDPVDMVLAEALSRNRVFDLTEAEAKAIAFA